MGTLGPTHSSVGTSVATSAELSAIVDNSLSPGSWAWANAPGSYYRYDPSSIAPVSPSAIPTFSSQGGLYAGRWILFTGGGGAVATVPGRRDHSVNGARVDGWENVAGPAGPTLRTQTNVNPAGGYSGGGTGNKAILGYYLPGPPYPAGGTMKLSDLASIEYTIDRIMPEVSTLNDITPYVNLLVLLNPLAPPAAQIFVVMVLADWGNAVPTGVFTPTFPPNPPVSGPGPNLIHMLWLPATDLVLVVNFEGMAGPPAVGVWPVIVPKTFGPPGVPTGLAGGGAWPG